MKATQSFTAYYQGRYRDALRHAQAGLSIAGSGSQRVRLLSNGVARAAGKLGESRVVDRAVNHALDLAAEDDCTGMTPCVTFSGYGSARTMANAATAFLSVGRYGAVIELADQLDRVVRESNSDWSRSLIQLDAASAHARGVDADLEHAQALGLRALDHSRSNPIASIGRRADELADDLERTAGRTRQVLEFRSAVRDWRHEAGLGVRPA